MIFIEHKDNLITSSLYKGESAVKGIIKAAQKHRDQFLIIHKKGIDAHKFSQAVQHLLRPYTIISSYNTLHHDLGYVEDGPFINIMQGGTYPTWIKSDLCFSIHASLILQLQDQVEKNTSLLFWTNSISKLCRPLGILCYQISMDVGTSTFSKDELYQFVKQHYKNRWIFFLFICHVWYDKSFPIFAFAKSLFYKSRRLKLNIAALQEQQTPVSLASFNYDVVIPTMGRPAFLKDVLNDLNHQVMRPQTVIIVEQNADEKALSELGFLQTEAYKFKVIHEFTHITGACSARNKALSLSTSPWVLLFDDDVHIKSNFSLLAKEFIEYTSAKCITFACLQKGEVEFLKAFKQWESFGSGCSLVHKDIIEKCRFDTALEHGYGEDVDYGMQIRKAGYDVIYAPQIQILHLKAPVGGFRKPFVLPWQKEEIQPKPSPHIMYFRCKNYSKSQLSGYKLSLFFKFYKTQSLKNPYKYLKWFKSAWNTSYRWSKKLV